MPIRALNRVETLPVDDGDHETGGLLRGPRDLRAASVTSESVSALMGEWIDRPARRASDSTRGRISGTVRASNVRAVSQTAPGIAGAVCEKLKTVLAKKGCW